MVGGSTQNTSSKLLIRGSHPEEVPLNNTPSKYYPMLDSRRSDYPKPPQDHSARKVIIQPQNPPQINQIPSQRASSSNGQHQELERLKREITDLKSKLERATLNDKKKDEEIKQLKKQCERVPLLE